MRRWSTAGSCACSHLSWGAEVDDFVARVMRGSRVLALEQFGEFQHITQAYVTPP